MKFIVIIVFLLSSISRAGAVDVQLLYNDLDIAGKHDFEFVTKTCHMNINSLAMMVESARDDSIDDMKYFFTMGESTIAQENIVTRRGIGKHLDRLLNSTGYYFGLMACFPNNETKRHQYTISLLLLDAFGKAATVSILTLSGASIYKSLSYLGKKLAVAPTVATFRKLKASEEFIAKVPKYMGAAGVMTFNVVTLGSLATNVYRMKKDREIMEEAFAEPDVNEARSRFEENLKLYEETKNLTSLAKTPDQRAVMENLTKEQRETVLFHLNNLLESEDSEHTKISPQEKENLLVLKQSIEKDT